VKTRSSTKKVRRGTSLPTTRTARSIFREARPDPLPFAEPGEAVASNGSRGSLVFLVAASLLFAGFLAWHVGRPAIATLAHPPGTIRTVEGP